MTGMVAQPQDGADFVPEVVVVGAGPTGVTAAILLGQAGVPTLVLDRWTEVFPQPRAVHLDDEIFRVLARLGVAEDFAKVSIPGAGLRLLSPEHVTLAQFDRTDPMTSNGFAQANMFDQPDLETILRARMASLASVRFLGDVEVQSVDPAGDRPAVRFTSISTQERHEVRPRFVLGCDGANSLVRGAIGSSMRDLGYKEQRWLVVDIATERDLGHWEGVHQVCDGIRAATYMRIGATRHRWEFELLPGESTTDFETLALLGPLLAPWESDVTDFELVRLAEYTFRAQVADKWQQGGTFILGDAAHLTPPFIGQGMGAGIRDAANLAWKVAEVVAGRLSVAALDSYEPERRPHARTMVKLACMVGRSMTGGGRAGDPVRRVVLPVLPKVPGLRGKVLESATPPLKRSALSHRRHTGGGLAGTLCPNAELASGERLDQLASGRFVLVTSKNLSADVVGVLASRNVVEVRATGTDLAAWLGRHQCALVRPDGTVMAAGSVTAVVGALRKL